MEDAPDRELRAHLDDPGAHGLGRPPQVAALHDP